MAVFKRILLFLSIAICYSNCNAVETTERESDPSTEETWEQYLIRKNVETSEWFDGVAEGLDLFLAGKRYTKKPNETSVLLELEGIYNKEDNFSGTANFNVDLRLPNVEEYLQLTFTSYDEIEDRRARNRYLRQTPRDRNYGATIGFFKRLGDVRTSFRPRIQFAEAPAISHSLAFESVVEKRHDYRINPKLEFYATPGRGAGVYQALNFNFYITNEYSLTLINEGDYEGRIHLYTVNHGVSLGQRLNRTQSLGYNFFVTFINTPNYRLEAVNLSAVWDHLLYKNILEYQVIPNLDFRKEHAFTLNPGIITAIKLHF